MNTKDLKLYLVTDMGLCRGRELTEIVYQALQGGVDWVQLREKDLPTRDFVMLAKRIKQITARFRVPLIINDRVDVALASVADGVHLGQSDMHPEDARLVLGSRAIIGLSVETEEQLREAENYDLDYLALSPIFTTPTKTDTVTEWGVKGIKLAKGVTRHHLAVIGRINKHNLEEVLTAGADIVAVVSAICSADSPLEESRQLKEIMKSMQKEKDDDR